MAQSWGDAEKPVPGGAEDHRPGPAAAASEGSGPAGAWVSDSSLQIQIREETGSWGWRSGPGTSRAAGGCLGTAVQVLSLGPHPPSLPPLPRHPGLMQASCQRADRPWGPRSRLPEGLVCRPAQCPWVRLNLQGAAWGT